ncbi:deoxyribose-phosphate aldolase [Aeromonas veronii]|uniref:deoxyribose-phosphate aldolase n=1 Tax=Aeromonas TaxID=642 RepID=UPI00111691DD|nr:MULTISPECIES: deoxyribose-phosphate aldolase [Aeromonas]TNI01471.1 deoxyribose-phosphate aldolase [Aeromonas veronii]HDO1310170.1 deoxyribose-phosphate aldolase [Aeromonas veronii]HDO1331665.1 deoxyribose-phosphate aldolase [Aeromonas veronii]HDO1336324.1 deoxyribose-phosphate aldolase [Aeromonas veronii]HDO1340698.1 deoxyribose-phosphate aldolase [Aeromonas veronii]
MISVKDFAKHFDLAYLSPNLQKKDIDEAVDIAAKYNVATLNLNPYWVPYANSRFAQKKCAVRASAVIGFPYGANTLETKMFEANQMLDAGASALDMVINIGALMDDDYALIRQEVKSFVSVAKGKSVTKLIFEVGFLSDQQIAELTKICCEEGIDYVKTATGTQSFPDVEHVKIMQANLSGKTKIKVSGVPRTFSLPAALFLFENFNCDLVGTRSAGKIIEQYKELVAKGALQ